MNLRQWLLLTGGTAVWFLGGLAVLHAQTGPTPETDLTIIERVLVKVNGQIISQTDLETRQINEIRSRGVPPRNNVELANLVREITPSVIANAVDELL